MSTVVNNSPLKRETKGIGVREKPSDEPPRVRQDDRPLRSSPAVRTYLSGDWFLAAFSSRPEMPKRRPNSASTSASETSR
jgi:hypothetical protein